MIPKERELYTALLLISESTGEHLFGKNIADKAIEKYHQQKDTSHQVTPENYKRLLFALLDLREMPSKSEMENLVKIVHEDFPVENHSPVI